MDDFKLTDEQLRYLCDLVINHNNVTPDQNEIRSVVYENMDAELTRREELAEAVAFLDDDCLSCKL